MLREIRQLRTRICGLSRVVPDFAVPHGYPETGKVAYQALAEYILYANGILQGSSSTCTHVHVHEICAFSSMHEYFYNYTEVHVYDLPRLYIRPLTLFYPRCGAPCI